MRSSLYRRKYDAGETLEAFSAKRKEETDLGRLGDEMVTAVRETMQPAHVGLLLRLGVDAKVTDWRCSILPS